MSKESRTLFQAGAKVSYRGEVYHLRHKVTRQSGNACIADIRKPGRFLHVHPSDLEYAR